MTSPAQIEFLKVLACMAWADEELARAEINLIGRLMHDFRLSGEERMEVEMYLDEKVGSEEARRVTRRFLARVRSRTQRKQLVAAVEQILGEDGRHTQEEQEWLQELHDAIAESGGNFLVDGLRSLLRLGLSGAEHSEPGRDRHFHDFIHNRLLFKLRHRVGAKVLEREAKPERLKKVSLCATFLARVGYVDEDFLPQEKHFIEKLLSEVWGVSPVLAAAICDLAMETANSVDFYRLIQEAKATLPTTERKSLIEALFGLAQAEGKMTGSEVEEIRKIAHRLELTHRQFINAKLKVLDATRRP